MKLNKIKLYAGERVVKPFKMEGETNKFEAAIIEDTVTENDEKAYTVRYWYKGSSEYRSDFDVWESYKDALDFFTEICEKWVFNVLI